jgi:hypothetical protein
MSVDSPHAPPVLSRQMRLLPVVWLLLFGSGCSTYSDDLARSQHAFEENQHETALAIQRMLELDLSHLDTTEQARYAYLRGMTDYRIGYKADARHWLAVAKAMDEKRPGIIPPDWRTRLDTSLAELDSQVWTAGMESLASTPASDKRRAGAKKHPPPPKKQEVAQPTEEEEEEAPPPPPKKKKPVDEDE